MGMRCMLGTSRIVFSLPRPCSRLNTVSLYSLIKCQDNLWPSWNSKINVDRIVFIRRYCDGNKSKAVSELKSDNVPSTSFQQVKEATKTVSYLGVIVFGLGVTGVIMYAVFHELFSSKSPNNIYTAALDRCCTEPRVLNTLGDPIKGFGEETRRGRRRHTSHIFYQKEGVNRVRMKFYIQGSRRRGTVHLEMKENDRGQFEYRYLIVKMDDYPPDTIILEDNRYNESDNKIQSLL